MCKYCFDNDIYTFMLIFTLKTLMDLLKNYKSMNWEGSFHWSDFLKKIQIIYLYLYLLYIYIHIKFTHNAFLLTYLYHYLFQYFVTVNSVKFSNELYACIININSLNHIDSNVYIKLVIMLKEKANNL